MIRTNSRLFNEEDENDVIFAKSSGQTQYQEGSESGAEKTDDRSFAKIDSHLRAVLGKLFLFKQSLFLEAISVFKFSWSGFVWKISRFQLSLIRVRGLLDSIETLRF
jgi:hypothetical protein